MVVDADQVARAVVEPGEPALAALVERFGAGILDADGRLDRPALAAIAFADDEGRKALGEITWPAIGEEFERQVREAPADGVVVLRRPAPGGEQGRGGAPYVAVVVVEAPLEPPARARSRPGACPATMPSGAWRRRPPTRSGARWPRTSSTTAATWSRWPARSTRSGPTSAPEPPPSGPEARLRTTTGITVVPRR